MLRELDMNEMNGVAGGFVGLSMPGDWNGDGTYDSISDPGFVMSMGTYADSGSSFGMPGDGGGDGGGDGDGGGNISPNVSFEPGSGDLSIHLVDFGIISYDIGTLTFHVNNDGPGIFEASCLMQGGETQTCFWTGMAYD